jgi:hypothetical protein
MVRGVAITLVFYRPDGVGGIASGNTGGAGSGRGGIDSDSAGGGGNAGAGSAAGAVATAGTITGLVSLVAEACTTANTTGWGVAAAAGLLGTARAVLVGAAAFTVHSV